MTPRFYRVGDDTMIVEFELDDVRRPRDRRIDCSTVSSAPIKAEIAGSFVGNLRGACNARRCGRGHCWQRVEVESDPFGSVEGLIAGLRDDQHHRLTDITDLALGQ